jgi:hypothetical protein
MNWKKLNSFVSIQSPWLRLLGEKWQNEQQQILDYWRVEKADSVIIITLYRNQFILPKPMFRVGLGEPTLDFAGGRLTTDKTPVSVVPSILQRELDITEEAIISLNPINQIGWSVNSSFSNQKLYGFVAEIDPNWELSIDKLGEIYADTSEDVERLLDDLICLQCRSLLLEFLLKRKLLI